MSVPHADRDHSGQPRRCAWCGSADCDARIERTPSTTTAGSDPTQGTPRSVSARVVRASEAQVEAAWYAVREFGRLLNQPQAEAVADAVVAAGPDADEVTRLRRWKAEATEVILGLQDLGKALGLPLGERITGTSAAQAAKALRSRAEGAESAVDRLTDLASDEGHRRINAEAEVARLRAELKRLGLEVANVARERSAAEAEAARLRRAWDTHDTDCAAVEAERDRLAEVVARVEALAETMANEHGQSWNSITARRIRIHLSGPTPAETPQNGPEPALSREQGESGQSGEGQALRGAEKGEEAGR